ncbi:uncharacterized protein LODBEIA_P12730 [Lodderomyces beijingensis]|uniref:Rho GDP-dissociation inhibitor n=1 Tax=Lodderomyces beijingensis TaxID=1775926 RepID=A0ABP0ZFV8_9ASCO
MAIPTHPDLIPIEFVLHVVGKDPVTIPVRGVDSINIKIPGGAKYFMTIKFQVKNRTLKDIKYKQNVKKGGITIRARELEIGTFEPSETEIYTKDFPEDETPGGWLLRGNYYATSTYYAGDELLMAVDWTLEITA